MARASRGLITKCPIFTPGGVTQSECLAERDGHRFLVTRYRNGNLVVWKVPNRGHSITKARREGRLIPISTPTTKSLTHLLDEATRYIRRHDKPRA